ncbi:phosphoribosylaminoimidazole carboxylase [Lacticaseibacillus songhuajiangensis]|uniref:phosphoribosylaminoimidazole carboxylase n=1 Tax=Lacticaseibacillus songhuajiangensis TaxID=1296539 RepID=UPI000F77D88D|nr:phosphoribosylaminoimidazole carboxylase [Lacticaseibacillus songhuajiangensis]
MDTASSPTVFIVVHAFTMPRPDQRHNGVVEVLYIARDEEAANHFMQNAAAEKPDDYFAVYPAALGEDLSTKAHYPSVEIEWEDLQ